MAGAAEKRRRYAIDESSWLYSRNLWRCLELLSQIHSSCFPLFPPNRAGGGGVVVGGWVVGTVSANRLAPQTKRGPAEPRSRGRARTGRIKLISIRQLLFGGFALKLRGGKDGGSLQLSEDVFESWSPGTHTHTHTTSLSSSVLHSLLPHHNKPGLLAITPSTGTHLTLTLMASLGF